MTFKQAHELGAHVRQREKGSLVVYTDTVHKTETDERPREDVEKAILFMKGYTVFNAEQVDDLPIHDYASRNGLPFPRKPATKALNASFGTPAP